MYYYDMVSLQDYEFVKIVARLRFFTRLNNPWFIYSYDLLSNIKYFYFELLLSTCLIVLFELFKQQVHLLMNLMAHDRIWQRLNLQFMH